MNRHLLTVPKVLQTQSSASSWDGSLEGLSSARPCCPAPRVVQHPEHSVLPSTPGVGGTGGGGRSGSEAVQLLGSILHIQPDQCLLLHLWKPLTASFDHRNPD